MRITLRRVNGQSGQLDMQSSLVDKLSRQPERLSTDHVDCLGNLIDCLYNYNDYVRSLIECHDSQRDCLDNQANSLNKLCRQLSNFINNQTVPRNCPNSPADNLDTLTVDLKWHTDSLDSQINSPNNQVACPDIWKDLRIVWIGNFRLNFDDSLLIFAIVNTWEMSHPPNTI